ncbi:MAG: hypothetical protein HY960_15110 [Ignavibacteriae bacterium]|nr:hypothetical protein [Ignavibacteriota bacterium]
MTRYLFTFSLILLAAFSRLVPHPVNFAPIAALALFGGVYLDKKHTFLVPLVALFLSDYFLGFYSGMIWVYGSFAAIGVIGLWVRNHRGIATTIGATLLGSLLFFIVTNFGVWISSHGMYPRTFAGLIECYVAAIPFFRNSVLGDFAYVTAMFGVYELAKKFFPSLSLQQQ